MKGQLLISHAATKLTCMAANQGAHSASVRHETKKSGLDACHISRRTETTPAGPAVL